MFTALLLKHKVTDLGPIAVGDNDPVVSGKSCDLP